MDTSQVMVPARRRKQVRRYRTNAEKRRIVEELLSGETPAAEIARRYEVNANLLFNWRKLYQQGLLDQCREPGATNLVAVRVEETPSQPIAGAPVDTDGHIEIELPGEVRVRLHGRVDGEALAKVLAVLQSR